MIRRTVCDRLLQPAWRKQRVVGRRASSTAATTTTAASEQAQRSQPGPYVSGSSTHFGFAQVSVNEKEGRVRQVFDNVADSYDLMNDLMSAGLHRYWKDYLLDNSAVESMARAVRRQHAATANNNNNKPLELKILDVAGGTGDVAFRFIDAANCLERSKSSGTDPVQVTVCDINHEMLRVGQQRARQRYGNALLDESRALQFVVGNAQELTNTFADNSFDLYTIAFGLRNVTNVDQALHEAHRVLKPGGRFMCLEFASQLPNPVLQKLYDCYSFSVIPTMGAVVAQDRDSYQYLVESIRQFSSPDELVVRMQQAGMQQVSYTLLAPAGVVALHTGYKGLE